METEIFPTKSYSEIKKGLPASTLKATGGAYDGGSENYIVEEMKLRELVEKIDNDAPLFIVWGPNAEAIFKRENASDVIPKNLLCMEVGTFFPCCNGLDIEVKRNFRKGSFRELLNCLNSYDCIDVYVVNRDGTKEKVYSERAALCTNYKYDNYLVKRISPHRSEWGDKLEIEIEPVRREEEDTQEGRRNETD